MSPDNNLHRDRLEANANALRSRLARTLESLDRRRHDAFNVKVQAKRHPGFVAAVGGAMAAVAAGSGLITYLVIHHRRSRGLSDRLSDRLHAVTRIWQHPDRVARQKPHSLPAEIARGVLVSLASFVVSQLAERALLKALPQLSSDPTPRRATPPPIPTPVTRIVS
jgi:hypothetical protein